MSSENVLVLINRELAERMSEGKVYAVQLKWHNDFECEPSGD